MPGNIDFFGTVTITPPEKRMASENDSSFSFFFTAVNYIPSVYIKCFIHINGCLKLRYIYIYIYIYIHTHILAYFDTTITLKLMMFHIIFIIDILDEPDIKSNLRRELVSHLNN